MFYASAYTLVCVTTTKTEVTADVTFSGESVPYFL